MEENEEVAYLLRYPGVRELVDRMTLVINERTAPTPPRPHHTEGTP